MIQLRALGVLDLRTGDNAEIRQVLAQPKRAALLAYLVLATPRGAHPRDQLLAMFWPDQAPEPARNALSQAVHFLRRALGDDVIVSHGDTLSVAPATIWCDVIAFDEAIAQGRMDDAIELYRGDFLEGFHVANAPEFERWLDAERQRHAERFDAALEAKAVQCEQGGASAAALTYRRRLAARAPYNSAIALKLMRSFAAAGDPAAAIHHAQVHEKLLRADLDVPLPTDIRTLVAELQRPHAQPAARVLASRQESGPPQPQRESVELERRRNIAGRFWPTGRKRIAALTAVLIMASVGAAYALVARGSSEAQRLQELFRRGRNAEVNRSLVGIQTAMQYYRTAIARDSTFALGYAALSQSFVHMAHYDFAPKRASLDSARLLAHRAMSLDSTRAEARTAMGYSLANSGHLKTAEGEFRRAIALEPDNAVAHAVYSMLLIALGRGEEAVAQADISLKLDPLGPRMAHAMKKQATYLVTGKRPDRALPTAERRPILQVEAEPWARAQQAVELAEEGRCEDARKDISVARSLVPDSNMVMLAFAGVVLWQCDERDQARALLARMKQRRDADEHAMRVAALHARMGDMDSAFVWLDRHHWLMSDLATIQSMPLFDTLRPFPGYARLLRRLGLR